MKAFWDDLFFDMDECGMNREGFAMKAGDHIRGGLRQIGDAIREHDGKKALALIEELKNEY